MSSGQITVQATPSTTVNIATDYDSVNNVHTNKTIVANLSVITDDTEVIKTRLNELKTNQNTHNTHLTDIKANQSTQNTHLTDIKANQAAQNTHLTDIKTNLTDIKANQVTQNTHLTDIKTNQATQNTHLTDIKAGQIEVRNRLAPAFSVSADDYSNNRQVVKSSAGVVYSLFCENTTSSLRYFQLHNKSTDPSNGDTPIKSIPVPPNSAVGLGTNEFGAAGVVCSNGVAWAWSSTRTALTLATGTEKTSWVGWS